MLPLIMTSALHGASDDTITGPQVMSQPLFLSPSTKQNCFIDDAICVA